MTKNYETIIWDWNGTIINDVHICVDIANTMLTHQNQPTLSTDDYRNAFGFPISDYYKRIGIDLELESMKDLTKKFIPAYMEQVRTCNLHQNIIETLSHFKQTNREQYILTAGHKEDVIELLQHYNILHFFKEVEGLDNYRAESKVDRGIALLKDNHIEKEHAVLIGDTDHDYEVAQAIGIDCILITNGHQSKEKLIQATNNAIPILDGVDELI